MTGSRKRSNVILRRDGEFTQSIGNTGSSKPSALGALAQELRGKLEAVQKPEPAQAQPETMPSAQQGRQPDQVAPASPPITEELSQEPPAPAENPAVPPERSIRDTPKTVAAEHAAEPSSESGTNAAPAASSTIREPDAARAGATDGSIEIALTIRIHSDLKKRAETWAAAVGLPPVTLLRNSLNRFKPELMESLRTIKAGDVHLERAESVGQHMQTRVRFTPAEYADMEARLDPAGFGVLRSMLNHHARARFSDFLDRLMIGAGY